MTRIALITDEEAAPAARAIFDEMTGRGAKIPDLYRLLAHAPDLFEAWTRIAWPLRNAKHTERGLRELLIMRVAILTRAEYEWAHHWGLAVAAGVEEQKLHALAAWRESDLFDETERRALAFADALVEGGDVPPDIYAALSAHFEPAQVIHLALTISFYVCVSHMASAFELSLEPAYVDKTRLPAAGAPCADR